MGMSTRWLHWSCLAVALALVVAPPPNRQAAQEHQKAEEHAQQANQEHQNQGQKPVCTIQDHALHALLDIRESPFQLYEFAYQKYLEQVVKILESDPKFNERLRGMKEEDIKVGQACYFLG